MRGIFTLILIVLCIAGHAQKKDEKPDPKMVKKMQKEFKKMHQAQGKEELIVIDPNLADEFIESVRINDTEKLWDLVDEDVKKVQTKEDLTSIFSLYDKYYGKLISYKQATFGMETTSSFGQVVKVTYDVQFEKYQGKGIGVFKVYDKNDIKMLSFNLSLEDYTVIEILDSIAQPTINAIKAKDKKQIYNLTSDLYKEYVSIADFESRIAKILEIEIIELKMFRQQFSIKRGNEVLAVHYEVNDKAGYLSLSYTKKNDIFELEGLNYKTGK